MRRWSVMMLLVATVLATVGWGPTKTPQYVPPGDFVEDVYCKPGDFYTRFPWTATPSEGWYRAGKPLGKGFHDPCGDRKAVFVLLTGHEQFVAIVEREFSPAKWLGMTR